MVACRRSTELITPLPADIPAEIRAVKRRLRDTLGDPRAALEVAAAAIGDEVAAVVEETADGGSAVPVVEYADVAAGTVPAEQVAAIRRRGCAVVRGTFERDEALAWDDELAAYLERNDFSGRYRGPADELFSALSSSRPQIYGVYWSRPQIAARQHERMVTVRRFLNSFWKHESERPAVVRSRPRHRLSRPHPPPPAEHAVARPVAARRLRLDRALAAPRLPARLPPRLRRRVGALRPVGRRPSQRDPRVPDDGDVLGVPDLPGLDGAVGDASR